MSSQAKGRRRIQAQVINEGRENKGRQATKGEKKAFADGALVNKGPTALAADSTLRRLHVCVCVCVCVYYGVFQRTCRQRLEGGEGKACRLTCDYLPHPVAVSATAALNQRRAHHRTVDTAAQLHVWAHVGRVSTFCSKESLAILSTPSAQMLSFQ
jgi:hypothetical protein